MDIGVGSDQKLTGQVCLSDTKVAIVEEMGSFLLLFNSDSCILAHARGF